MLDTQLQARLEQLLAAKGAPAPAARANAVRITRLIRGLHPIAQAATAVAQGRAGQLHGDTSSGAKGAVSTAGTGAAIGTAILPGIGTVVGAAVGLVVGFVIGNKSYMNVNTANSTEDQDALDIWPQYRQAAGSVAGRDIGLPLLERAWRGAVYTGQDFTLNNARKCFHAGCLKYPGNPDWIHAAIYGAGGANAQYTFPYAVANAGSADPRAVAQFFIAHETQSPPWGVPKTAAGLQLLVDIADAMLASKGAPYTYGAPQVSAALAQPLAQPAPTVAPGAVSLSPPVMPQTLIATTPSTSSDQLLSTLLAQQGVNASSPQAQQLVRDVSTQGVQSAGFAGLGLPSWVLVGGAVLALGAALAVPVGKRAKPRAAA